MTSRKRTSHKNRKIKYCSICGTMERVEKHHLFPKVHYGQSPRVLLCNKHHRQLERFIQMDEGILNGKRIKQDKQFYLDKLIKFLTRALVDS